MRLCKFTLVELLIVIAIITILASFLLPALGASKEYARGIQCLGNLRQFEFGNLAYADSYNSWELPAYYGYGSSYAARWFYDNSIGTKILEPTLKDCMGLGSIRTTPGWPRNFFCPSIPANPLVSSIGLIDGNQYSYSGWYGLNVEGIWTWGVDYMGFRQTQVVSPSSKINFIDSTAVTVYAYPSGYTDLWLMYGDLPLGHSSMTAYRHHGKQGANIAFHDGHAAYLPYQAIQRSPMWFVLQ